MNEQPPEKDVEEGVEKDAKKEKWEFEDYAFTITGIIVGVLLVVPNILESQFGITIFGGSFDGIALGEGLEYGIARSGWDFNQLRVLSPMLFLLTTTICMFKDVFDARKTGGYTGSMFTHTFESLLEDAIYMAINTVIVYSAILVGAMWSSWLAAPISWILFIFIFPIVRNKSSDHEEIKLPWLLLFIFISGIVVESITGGWIAFPLSWLIICAIQLVASIREADNSLDAVFNISYYALSIIVMAAGILLNFWYTSWAALLLALFICWVLSKFKRFKKVEQKS